MKTEANTRPDNRKVKQARLKKKQAMALFKRRLANLSKTDLTDSEYKKRSEALRKEYMKIIKPLAPILQEGDEKALDRKVQQAMSDKGYSSGRSTNSNNRKVNPNSASTPGKGSDEPITKKNKGGLIRTGNNDMRKGGLFR
jgi:hypothetical protein